MPNIDFLAILGFFCIFAFVVILLDIFLPGRKALPPPGTKTKEFGLLVVEYARALFPVILIVLLLRSFVAQPYRVPTGSLEPTIMPGDFILVTQYSYGLRTPLWNKEFLHLDEPKVGQIALFHWPVNTNITFVKRVIGVPGDRISYINKVFYINGKEAKQTYIGNAQMLKDEGGYVPAKEYEETINGIKHFIYVDPKLPPQNFTNLLVPKGEYFMSGDNRDASNDSRSWGFVPENLLIGEARMVFFSWNKEAKKPRWDRIGNKL